MSPFELRLTAEGHLEKDGSHLYQLVENANDPSNRRAEGPTNGTQKTKPVKYNDSSDVYMKVLRCFRLESFRLI